MKTKNDYQSGLEELNHETMIQIDGGGFGYDLGFFIREVIISAVNGGGIRGTAVAAADFCLNYAPVNQ